MASTPRSSQTFPPRSVALRSTRINATMTNETIQISEREREILRLVATGATNQQIASQLNISINTVKVHLRNIFGKIGAASRTEATLYAVRTGLVPIGEATLAAPSSTVAVADPPAEPNPDLAIPAESGAGAHSADTLAEEPAASIEHRHLPDAIPDLPAAAPPRAGLSRGMLLGGAGAVLLVVVGLVFWLARPTLITPPAVTPTAAGAATPGPSWRGLAPLPAGRAGFALSNFSYEGKRYLYAIGGDLGAAPSDQVARFDLATNTWASLSAKPTPVSDVQGVVIGNRIYVPGGRLGSGAATDVFEAYDPQHDRWTKLKPLPQPRSGYALAVMEGKLYLFGGWDGAAYHAEVWQYDPDKDEWADRAPMPTARAFAAAAVVENAIYVLGGENASGALAVNERYIPSDDAGSGSPWATKLPLPTPAGHMSAAWINDQLFVLGAGAGQVLVYNSSADQWRTDKIPLADLRDLRVQAIGSKIYIVGGRDPSALSTQVYEYQAIYSVLLPVVVN
jgi:DNA-binding CsgD family transcriptional regulator